jgi:sugar phosphate isomerase/epimerase
MREAGYEGIVFLQDFGQPHGLEASASDDHVRSVREKMAMAGLIVSSLSSSCSFHSLDESERRRNINQSKRVIEQAVIIGCDRVCVLGDKLPDDDAGHVLRLYTTLFYAFTR